MARPHVPQFGKWEADGNNIPYTVVFDKARQGRGGKIINPNDPQQNPTAFAHRTPPTNPQTTQPNPVRHRPIQQNDQRRQGLVVVDHNRSSSSRTSIGSEHSIDRSPLHQYQPKVTGRGNVSSNANRTPGRARTKNTDANLHGSTNTVPPFGGWDVKNPNAGAGLTKIFDDLSYEKRIGTPNITTETHDYRRDRPAESSNIHSKAKSSCWPWFRR